MKLLLYENERYRRSGIIDENNELVYYKEEFKDNLSTHGNVYIGTIKKISKSNNSAFVDFGFEKMGFLNLHSVHPEYFRTQNKKDIINHIGKSDIHSAYKKIKIDQVLCVGDKLLVQVIRENTVLDSKGSMLSTFITLRGKYLKYIPNSCQSYSCLPNELRNMNVTGSIFYIQKNQNNINPDVLCHDLTNLLDTWNSITKKFKQNETTLYINEDFIYRPLEFPITETKIETLSKHFFERYNYLLPNISYGKNIFQNLDECIDTLSSPSVQLGLGGYMIITPTAACTTIDINLGHYDNKHQQDAILEVNKSAVKKIYEHIILRDIGGVIIIDFIDMNHNGNKVIETLIKEYFKNDTQKVNFSNISQFGIMQICRQYKKQNILKSQYQECVCCDKGFIYQTKYKAEKLCQEINYITNSNDQYECIEIFLSPSLSEYILNKMSQNQFTEFNALKNYKFIVQEVNNKLSYNIIVM